MENGSLPSSGWQFLTVAELASQFKVTCRTVRRWIHDGIIHPRIRLRGGTCYQYIFPESEINRFFDEYFPQPKDLDLTHETGSRKNRVEMIRRIRNMHRIYAGKATAAKVAKKLAKEHGLKETELESHQEDYRDQDKQPAILDHRPGRSWNYQDTQPEMPKDRGQDRWDDRDRWEEEDDPYNDGD